MRFGHPSELMQEVVFLHKLLFRLNYQIKTIMSIFSNLFGEKKSSISTKIVSNQSDRNSNLNQESLGVLEQISATDRHFKLHDLTVIPINGEYSLKPLDAKSVFEDTDKIILDGFSQTERIKKYLPLLDFSKPKNSSKDFFFRLVKQTEMGLGFCYAIRQNDGLLGAIMIDTPTYNKHTIGFDQWTISFFVLEIFENRRLMSISFPRILHFLKTRMGVNQLYAIVDSDNSRSLHLLQKYLFSEISNSGWNIKNGNNIPKIFCCDMSTINFK